MSIREIVDGLSNESIAKLVVFFRAQKGNRFATASEAQMLIDNPDSARDVLYNSDSGNVVRFAYFLETGIL